MFKRFDPVDETSEAFLRAHPDLSKPLTGKQDKAEQYITRFAGKYATTSTLRDQLQHAIDASQPVNCPVAPSERPCHIASFTECFRHVLNRDPSLNGKLRTEQLQGLRKSLLELEEPFDLPERQRSR